MGRSPSGVDALRVLESVYQLDRSDADWFRELAATLDFTAGRVESHWAGGVVQVRSVDSITVLAEWSDAPGLPVSLAETIRLAPREDRAGSFLGPVGLRSFSDTVKLMPRTGRLFQSSFAAAGYPDGGFIFAREPGGVGAVFARFCTGEIPPPSAIQRRRMRQIALHIASAIRLRSVLPSHRKEEAILDPSGRTQHCEGFATSRGARGALRDAVLQLDRSRSSRGRADVDTAMDRWTALIEGRWTLVERFESDGRRFFVAFENQSFASDPRGLTANERTVALRVSEGHSSKLLAYELGLSEAMVSRHLKGALRKLGFASAAELAYHCARLRAGGAGVYADELRDFSLGVLCVSAARGALDVLSPSEYDVASLAIRGHSNAAIAEARGVSIRTVQNQIAGVYNKLGLRTRAELAIAMAGGPSTAANPQVG